MDKKRCLPSVDDSQPRKKQKVMYRPVPVRTIQVTNTAYSNNALNRDYLRGYFEGVVGPVSDVTIADKSQDGKHIRTAYVTFVLPEDALRSISETNHKFVIKEAERVFQPMFDPNTLKFEELNDDCFFKIVSYLDLIDIVNLGKSSTRLQSFAKLIYRKKTRFTFGNHDEDSTSNESNLKPILQALGSYIQSLVWNSMEQRHLQYLSQYCSNVTELSITGSWEEIPSTVYQRNSKLFIKLEKLRIKESAISDCALKTLASSNELKYLQLYGCRDITSKFFAEWKPSKLETLKVKGTNDDILLCKDIFAFVKKNKLMKFSYDDLGSLQICLSLPSIYLSTFEELDLNYEDLNDDKLKSLNFKGLKRLQHLGLNCYFESFSCCNELLMAVSQIPALTSLTISGIIIDDKTLRCLGSIKSLRKIRIDFFANKIGGLFHSSLYAHLPAITELSLYEDIEQYDRDATEKDDINSSICAMITSIRSLRYFASESTTWELLAMILQGQERTKRPSIEIGVTKPMFRNPKKKVFEAAAKGMVKLSTYDRPYVNC